MKARHLFCFAFLGSLVATSVSALPAQRRLFTQTYHYSVSCMLCHTNGGGSSLTKYGKDFLRNGASIAALRRIEKLDSDNDGFSNIDEILSRSNPGDPLSTPKNSGKWLENIEEDAIPVEILKKGFKDSEGFALLEGVLKPAQVQAVEKSLGEALSDEDKVPVFYFAIRQENGKRMKYGVAQFIRQKSFTLLVGIHLNGTVAFVEVVKAQDPSLKKESGFLAQFEGKSVKDLLVVGKTIIPIPQKTAVSQEIATAVHKNLLMISTVFSKEP